jgi:hypothetical protein
MGSFESDQTHLGDGFVSDSLINVGSILTDAYLHCVTSSLRFGFKTTEILVKGQLSLLHQFGRPIGQEFPDQTRTAIDEARGCLRELADIASLEFSQLHRKLAALEEAARNLVPAVQDNERPYRRRWKAKL